MAPVARPSSAAGSSTVPVRVVLIQPTATGGETPPKLAGEDAYATSGGRRQISHSVLPALSKNGDAARISCHRVILLSLSRRAGSSIFEHEATGRKTG